MISVGLVSCGVVRVECNGSLQLRFRSRPGPFQKELLAREREVGFRECLVKFDCFSSCFIGFRHCQLRGPKPKVAQKEVSIRQPGPSLCVSRVFLNGLFKVPNAPLQTFFAPLVRLVTTLEISFERLGVNWVSLG